MLKGLSTFLLILISLCVVQGFYYDDLPEDRDYSELDKRSLLPPGRFNTYDYEDNRDKRGYNRAVRYEIVKTVENGKTYSIQNLKDKLYLTAKTGRSNPSPVVVSKFTGGDNQLWKVSHLGNGVPGKSLKSVKNEFNKVTSRLDYIGKTVGVSHSFVPWQIQEFKGKMPRGLEDYNPFTISHQEGNTKVCLQSNGLLREVSRVKCNPMSPAQLWAFRNEAESGESNIIG